MLLTQPPEKYVEVEAWREGDPVPDSRGRNRERYEIGEAARTSDVLSMCSRCVWIWRRRGGAVSRICRGDWRGCKGGSSSGRWVGSDVSRK